MPPTNSFGSYLSSGAAGLAVWFASCCPLTLAADLPRLALLPMPAEIRTMGAPPFLLAGEFRVAIVGYKDARLSAGASRMLARLRSRSGIAGALAPDQRPKTTLVIECAAGGPSIPQLGDDESYTLQVGEKGVILRAANVVGGLRGLETFLQLVQRDGDHWSIPAVEVRDHPRFLWRGLMIDVARHWQPIEVIKRNLDGMALVKLNVLHLHLSDDQGFRIESLTHPELQGKGSDGHYFTQAEIREILAYASERGIRVVPEFDLPGHATSWAVSHPELASLPGPYSIERKWGVFDPVLDPTNEELYRLLEDFLGEMAALFPDQFFHIGGDENNGVQWNANPRIQAYIREHDLKNNEGLHAFFNRRVSDILTRKGKRLIGWDEILNPGLPPGTVIHSWRGAKALAAAAQLGFQGILSNGFYIDLNHSAADHYAIDPLPADAGLDAELQTRVLGGEATMWSEWVTPQTIDNRIWPRTAAIAERLWSPREVRDVDSLYERLAVIDNQLAEVGLLHKEGPQFAGVPLEIAGALRALAGAVEPVKDYRRGQLQPDHTQLTPLNQLADWASPESEVARRFNRATNRWLFAPGELAPDSAQPLRAQLLAWKDAGALAGNAGAPATDEGRARLQVARSLVEISGAGLEAFDALLEGKPLAPERQAEALAALDRAAEATAAAVEFPALPTLRLLVAAAASDPDARKTMARDAWKKLLDAKVSAATVLK